MKNTNTHDYYNVVNSDFFTHFGLHYRFMHTKIRAYMI